MSRFFYEKDRQRPIKFRGVTVDYSGIDFHLVLYYLRKFQIRDYLIFFNNNVSFFFVLLVSDNLIEF